MTNHQDPVVQSLPIKVLQFCHLLTKIQIIFKAQRANHQAMNSLPFIATPLLPNYSRPKPTLFPELKIRRLSIS